MNRTIIALAVTALALSSCETTEKRNERLARRYCSACHAFPDPGLLDKKSWDNGVFPEMALRMGVDFSRLQTLHEHDLNEVVKVLPSKAMVTDEEWQAIRAYYLGRAPDSLTQVKPPDQSPESDLVAIPVRFPSKLAPFVSVVKYDTLSKSLFFGTRHARLFRLNAQLELKDSFDLPSAPSDIIFLPDNEIIVSCMGIMDPNDQAAGKIIQLNTETGNQTVLIDSIKRPVEVNLADLDGDVNDEFLVSAFGNYSGELVAFKRKGGGFERHMIHPFAGNRRTVLRDFNGDGRVDILALVTQGDERILLLTNEGKFNFRPSVLLRFSPVYGSSYFDIADFNGDGHFDILYTNGDNADYSPVLKPYHGVRIFINNGKNSFSEKWFHPMHGASKALARDFDRDGDLDIAAISFFPDFSRTPEFGFIYFENSNGEFAATRTSAGALGRWLVMDAGDIDGDGAEEIILGALNFPATVPPSLRDQWTQSRNGILVLKSDFR